jgi:hypothetical protein
MQVLDGDVIVVVCHESRLLTCSNHFVCLLVVFFGESLPGRFHRLLKEDLPKADLLLIMGTSLQVAPVSLIPNMVSCNRVLFNRDLVMKTRKGRDIFVAGDCDKNVLDLCNLLGWGVDLIEAHTASRIVNEEVAGERSERRNEVQLQLDKEGIGNPKGKANGKNAGNSKNVKLPKLSKSKRNRR